jgi:hypothetical protein
MFFLHCGSEKMLAQLKNPQECGFCDEGANK